MDSAHTHTHTHIHTYTYTPTHTHTHTHTYIDRIFTRECFIYFLENVSAFELQLKLIQVIDCNLAIWLIESKYIKMTKAIKIIEL